MIRIINHNISFTHCNILEEQRVTLRCYFANRNVICTYCLPRDGGYILTDSRVVEGRQGTGQQQQEAGRHLSPKKRIHSY